MEKALKNKKNSEQEILPTDINVESLYNDLLFCKYDTVFQTTDKYIKRIIDIEYPKYINNIRTYYSYNVLKAAEIANFEQRIRCCVGDIFPLRIMSLTRVSNISNEEKLKIANNTYNIMETWTQNFGVINKKWESAKEDYCRSIERIKTLMESSKNIQKTLNGENKDTIKEKPI